MDLEFEVKGKQILRANIQVLASKNSKCLFIFQSNEWWDLDKYIIFWTNEGKSIIKYLGKGDKCECRLPEKIMKDNLFSIQIYANDTYKTQKLKVGAIPEEYTISNPKLKHCKEKKTFQENDSEVLLYKVFSLMENKIDDIKYNNGFLECYSDKQLICKTPIFRNIRQEIRENTKSEVDNSLNNIKYDSLKNRPNLSAVATSGNYNDLNNKPTLSTVATSGNYSDLTNKPTIPAAYTHPTPSGLGGAKGSGLYKISTDANGHVTGTMSVSGSDLPSHTHNYANSTHNHTYSDLTNVSTVAVVVTYTDDSTETLNLLKYTPPSS